MEVKMKKKEGKENFEENSSSMFIDLSGVKLV